MDDLSPELADAVATRFSVLGEPTRLRLLNLLSSRGEASVGELVEAVGTTQANVSKHLSLLLADRMVRRRREGSRAFYSIADPTLMHICDEVCAGLRRQFAELHELVEQGERGVVVG